MIKISDIPKYGICPKCGKPMHVIELGSQAARLGVTVPPGSFVIECCDRELTIDDEVEAENLKRLLVAYHAQLQDPNRPA